MEMMEIILLAAGGIIFVLSFFIPDKKGASGGLGRSAENEIKELVSREMESLRAHVDEVVEESIADAMERTERSLERLTNEKIMAVNEYSDTVLAEIHKNHEEAVFLYDMLNNKHTSLKNTAAEVNAAVRQAEEAVHSLEQMIPEAAAAEGRAGEEADTRNQPEDSYAGPAAEPEKGETAPAEEGPEDGEHDYNNNEKILRLYRQGKPAAVIAKELELGIGEVRLVIDLFRKQPR